MTRAALLPAGSDPFLLAYWLRNFATWSQYVDEIRIAVCGALEAEPLAYIKALVAAIPKATLYHVPKRVDHGTMIGYLLNRTDADHVMLCEDDAFVRRPEMVEACFRFAEDGGIAATPRDGYGSSELGAASAKAYGKPHTYWPCFVFVARAHLMATDQWFGGTAWNKGDVVMGRMLSEPATSDTFVWTSYQLHAQELPERLLENHRLSGQTVPDDAPWFHVGSLSNGHGFMFLGDITEAAYAHEVGMYKQLPEGNALQRLGWWWRAWSTAEGAIPAYHRRYITALFTLTRDLGMFPVNIEWYNRHVADPVVNWAER